jgi:ubiquitin-protein ligase
MRILTPIFHPAVSHTTGRISLALLDYHKWSDTYALASVCLAALSALANLTLLQPIHGDSCAKEWLKSNREDFLWVGG